MLDHTINSEKLDFNRICIKSLVIKELFCNFANKKEKTL